MNKKIISVSLFLLFLFSSCSFVINEFIDSNFSDVDVAKINFKFSQDDFGSKTINYSWEKIARAEKYRIYYTTSDSSQKKLLITTNKTKGSILTSLNIGQEYSIWLAIITKNGNEYLLSKEAIDKYVMLSSKPDTPTDLSYKRLSNGIDITLTWTMVNDASYFDIYSSEEKDFSKSEFLAMTTTNGIDIHLKSNETYYFYVVAVSTLGMLKSESDVSEPLELMPKNTSEWMVKPVRIQGEENQDYVYFGEWPQTIKASSILLSEDSDYRGYKMGDDGAYYAPVTAKPYYVYSDTKFSNNNTVIVDKLYYFKVEPIKWKVLEKDENTYLLVADNAIITNVPYSESESVRELGEKTIDPNNYKYSTLRAFLNGKYEEDDIQSKEFDNHGFLQMAFAGSAKNNIETIEVDNSASSTVGGQVNKYLCENTFDKIFALSLAEAYLDIDFQQFATDYTIALGINHNRTLGLGNWWLRTPYYYSGNYAYYVSLNNTKGNSGNVLEKTIGIVPALCIKKSLID